MINQHNAKFGGRMQYSNGNIMILVVDEQGFTCSLSSVITIFSKAHGMSFSHK